jgi:hypothetical protein
LMEDQNTKLRFDTDAGGSRISTSVGGSLLGIGGDVVICDDLHDVSGIESEADRETVLRFFRKLARRDSTIRKKRPLSSSCSDFTRKMFAVGFTRIHGRANGTISWFR